MDLPDQHMPSVLGRNTVAHDVTEVVASDFLTTCGRATENFHASSATWHAIGCVRYHTAMHGSKLAREVACGSQPLLLQRAVAVSGMSLSFL